MATAIGTLFTLDTFSIDCTKEIISFLDLPTFGNLSCINKFCKNICSEDVIQRDVTYKCLKQGISRKNSVMRFQMTKLEVFSLRENHKLVTIGEDYLCLHLNDSCAFVNKETGQIQDINCKSYFR